MAESNATQAPDRQELKELSPSEYPTMLRISEALRKFVNVVGSYGSWLIIPLILITVLDITARKLLWHDASGQVHGMQMWLVANVGRVFESTILQELEWHFHTGLWALVLGYGYIWNTHVRVDLVRENLSMSKKTWIELLGVTFFLIPYTLIVVWFAMEYAFNSWAIGEISASQVGLSHRWIIKSVIVVGLLVAFLAGVSVWLQVFCVIRSPKNWRFPMMTVEWPEAEGDKFEGKERLDLSKAVDELERRAKASGNLAEGELPPKAGESAKA